MSAGAFALAALVLSCASCQALTYATINDVSAVQLTNGIQITVKADGILEWQAEDAGRYWWSSTYSDRSDKVRLRFAGARSSVANYIDVSMYPVSHVQTYVPQDVSEGVGISLVVGCYTPSSFTVAASPDRQSVIITVRSERTLEGGKNKAVTSVGDQKTELTCTFQEGLLSVQILKAQMVKVFGEIARTCGLNVVVDDTVAKRTVSMSLGGVKPEEALQFIASAYGLSLSNENDVYMISEGVPTDLSTYRASDTQSFPMKFVRAQTASELLPTFLYSYLHVNSEQNAVVVSAPSQMLSKIQTDLQKVDIAPPQIMIEALAIELSSADDLSISLGLKGQSQNMGSFEMNSESGGISYSSIGVLPNDFQAKLRALVSSHKAKIHSNPRMAVTNGQSAEIFIGARRFIRVEYLEYGVKAEKIQGVDVGTSISVTPWTGGNGEITTSISPKVSNIIELERETGLPTLATRTANTTVRVKDGETIVIGGLTQSQDYYTTRRIPILGSIPIVGPLFRSKSRSTSNTELVILITPKILTESGHLPDAGEESQLKERMLDSR